LFLNEAVSKEYFTRSGQSLSQGSQIAMSWNFDISKLGD
jgi:hypothetical protein